MEKHADIAQLEERGSASSEAVGSKPTIRSILDADGNPIMTLFDKDRWQENQKLDASYVLRAKPGWVGNPILRFPRNKDCPCGSGFRFKKCCLPAMPLHIPESELADHLEVMRECGVK